MTSTEHREALRLLWKSRHVPIGTILMGSLVLASVLSAVLTIIAESPASVMP